MLLPTILLFALLSTAQTVDVVCTSEDAIESCEKVFPHGADGTPSPKCSDPEDGDYIMVQFCQKTCQCEVAIFTSIADDEFSTTETPLPSTEATEDSQFSTTEDSFSTTEAPLSTTEESFTTAEAARTTTDDSFSTTTTAENEFSTAADNEFSTAGTTEGPQTTEGPLTTAEDADNEFTTTQAADGSFTTTESPVITTTEAAEVERSTTETPAPTTEAEEVHTTTEAAEPEHSTTAPLPNPCAGKQLKGCEDVISSCPNVFTPEHDGSPNQKCFNPEDGDYMMTPYCRKTCQLCCQDAKYNCADDPIPTIDCPTIEQDCNVFGDIAFEHCKSSCGWCTLSAKPCVDMAPNCASLRDAGLCSEQEVSVQCEKTCRVCYTPDCVDSSNRCGVWTKNGFCSDPFYTDDKADYCKRSCNIC